MVYNEFTLKSDLVAIISVVCAVISVACMVLFAIQLKRGKYNQTFKIVVETDVERALKDGVLLPSTTALVYDDIVAVEDDSR